MGLLSTFIERVEDLVEYVCVTVMPRIMGGGRFINAVGGANLLRWRWGDGGGGYGMLEFDFNWMV